MVSVSAALNNVVRFDTHFQPRRVGQNFVGSNFLDFVFKYHLAMKCNLVQVIDWNTLAILSVASKSDQIVTVHSRSNPR